MFRLLGGLIVVFVLVLGSPPAAAQEPLWSATMTAERYEIPDEGVVVGYNGDHPGAEEEPFGQLSNLYFDFNGTTYRVYVLAQVLEDYGREDDEGHVGLV